MKGYAYFEVRHEYQALACDELVLFFTVVNFVLELSCTSIRHFIDSYTSKRTLESIISPKLQVKKKTAGSLIQASRQG